jgi:hypothetical protein
VGSFSLKRLYTYKNTDLMGGTLSVKFLKCHKGKFGHVRNNKSHLNPRCEEKTEFLWFFLLIVFDCMYRRSPGLHYPLVSPSSPLPCPSPVSSILSGSSRSLTILAILILTWEQVLWIRIRSDPKMLAGPGSWSEQLRKKGKISTISQQKFSIL